MQLENQLPGDLNAALQEFQELQVLLSSHDAGEPYMASIHQRTQQAIEQVGVVTDDTENSL